MASSGTAVVRFQNKRKEWAEADVLVLEVAIGLDRCVHAWTRSFERA